MKQNTDALKNNATYRTQVGNILGLTAEQSTDAATLKQGIKGLQKALGFKDKAVDGALGPNTFKELKVRWEKRDPPNQEYQVFIKELITGKKAEQPAVIAPEPTANPILNEERTVKSNTIEVSLKNSVIEDRNRFGFRLFEDAKIVTDEQKGEAVSLELDGAIIDRDAYRITESSDKKSYELNIRAMDDNVLVGKEALKNALDK